MSQMDRWRGLLWRWRRWLVVLLVLAIVRAALPEVLRRVLISQASEALRARVDVGNVDLSLLRGGIALDDVAIWAPSSSATPGARAPRPPRATGKPETTAAADPSAAPSPSAAPTPLATANQPAANSDQPLIAWKRLAVEVRWLPLFRKTIQLRDVELDSPRIALDRLAGGQINLMALIPASKEPARPTPAATPSAAKSAWSFGIDRFVLRRGGIHFRDFEVKHSEPLEMNLEQIQVRDIALRPGLYGQPAMVHLQMAFDRASLRLDARLTMLQRGFGLDADLEAHGLPLRRSRLYIPKVGWSALQGELDAALHYRLETGKQNQVSGTVSLRNVAVRVAKLEEPALSWKNLTVKVDPVDLMAHRAAVTEVDLDGASVLVRPHGGDLLPLLSASAGGATARATPVTGSKTKPAAASTNQSDQSAWHWSVAAVHVGNSRVRLLGSATPVDLGITASAGGLADRGDQPGKVNLTVAIDKGTVALDGAVRVSPPAFGGSLKIADLSLPELVRATGAAPPDLLQSLKLGSDLTVEAGLAASGDGTAPPAGDVRVRGKLALADLHVTGVAPQDFSLTAKSIDLGIGQLDVPGVLPSSGTDSARDLHFKGDLAFGDLSLTGPDPKIFAVGAHAFELPITAVSLPLPAKGETESPGPIRVALGSARLENPTVQVTRTKTGFVLPAFSASPAKAQASPPVKAQASPPPQSASRAMEITLASLRIDRGAVAMSDRTVKPFFNGKLAPLDVDLSQVRWPGPSVGNLKLSAVSSEHGKLDVYGGLTGGKGWFEVDVDKLALAPFNPYATSFSSYSIGSGDLSVATKASFDKGDYYADNWITLHDLDVQGGAGESLFQKQFGIPLSMALALLSDVNGNIVLGIPVSGGAGGTKIDLFTVVRTALTHAIINALASPLKLVGAVFGGGGKAKPLVPAPIAFLTGRAAPAADGAAQVGQLGQLLASRPGIGVTLETAVTQGDARWLREQDLLKTWQNEGLFAKLGALTRKGTRDRVRDALEARAKDKPGKLSPEDAKSLDDWLAKQPPIAPARLRALAEARLQLVQKQLHDRSGVDSARVKLAEPAAALAPGAPAVSVKLGAVGR